MAEFSKVLSASAIAKELNKSTQEVNEQLSGMELITRAGDTWQLTTAGQSRGGSYKEHPVYGRYIAWPESLMAELDTTDEDPRQDLLTATSLGKVFDMQGTRMNLILSELGWIARTSDIKGWQITESGKRLGGIQSKHKETGRPYVRWPKSIVNNKILINSVRESKGEVTAQEEQTPLGLAPDQPEFREKFEAKLRAADGHYVRSRAEVIIDNWLYTSKIAHAYERRLPIEEEQYCDFFINVGRGVYVEYWGLESDPKYQARKEKKKQTYQKHGYQLIELNDKDVSSLDDVLPRKLREFGIETD